MIDKVQILKLSAQEIFRNIENKNYMLLKKAILRISKIKRERRVENSGGSKV